MSLRYYLPDFMRSWPLVRRWYYQSQELLAAQERAQKLAERLGTPTPTPSGAEQEPDA
jgi:hypothetical protein